MSEKGVSYGATAEYFAGGSRVTPPPKNRRFLVASPPKNRRFLVPSPQKGFRGFLVASDFSTYRTKLIS